MTHHESHRIQSHRIGTGRIGRRTLSGASTGPWRIPHSPVRRYRRVVVLTLAVALAVTAGHGSRMSGTATDQAARGISSHFIRADDTTDRHHHGEGHAGHPSDGRRRGRGRPDRPKPCEHPYPCGDEWPEALEGPFTLREVKYVRLSVPADHDDPDAGDIEIEGWIGLPELPEDVGAPVALTSSPYIGDAREGTPGQEQFWSHEPLAGAIRSWGVKPIELIESGYAAAFFSVRGTGNSGGCFDWFGPNEQQDQKAIVEWLAEQPWSNGRISMGGLSYRAAPPIQAAIQGLEPLKTVVIAGTIMDLYTATFTPQGALRVQDALLIDTLTPTGTSLAPPVGGGPSHVVEHLGVRSERLCPSLLDVMAIGERSWLNDDRNGEFWMERSYYTGLADVTASVLLAQGFKDVLNHGFQDSPVWRLTPKAPKRKITGQWAHAFPWPEAAELDSSWEHPDWRHTLFAWLDYWLKGRGTPPRLGVADYQDGDGTWHTSHHWPPAEARNEVLYLTGQQLTADPAEGTQVFRPVPQLPWDRRSAEWNSHPYQPWKAMCPDPVSQLTNAQGRVYFSEPLSSDTLLAGEPFAYLKLSSDQQGGTVRVQLAEIIGGETECDASGQPSNVRILTAGAADLRFHAGNFVAADFPIGEAAHVRVDLWDLAETIRAGSRLAIAIMGAEPVDEWTGQPYQPQLTIHAGDVDASQIILPVVSGSVGGRAPQIPYPNRPFLP